MPRSAESQLEHPLPTMPQAEADFETWLESRVATVEADFATKRRLMRQSAFSCLRGTFYRFMQHWPRTCDGLNDAPVVLAIGDLHVENYGSWRDAESRLAWGINDADEATALPYTLDLVRLCTSAGLAIAEKRLRISTRSACKKVLAGYRDCLVAGGRAFVLNEPANAWLRELATAAMPSPTAFWRKLEALPSYPKKRCPAPALDALRESLPDPNLEHRVVRRVAGMGSLGRLRLVALADWRGGRIAREVKPLCASVALWEQGLPAQPVQYERILQEAVRSPDPSVRVHSDWLIRRLAPDAARIDLSRALKLRLEAQLLYAMGWEIGNVHLGSADAIHAVQRDLERRSDDWLEVASDAMAALATADWRLLKG